MNLIILLYSIYLALTTALTIWVAHTLFRNGKLFLIDNFPWQQRAGTGGQ